MQISVGQAMSEHPMTVRSKDDLKIAYGRMKREDFRHLVVIDDSGKLVGLISDRDFKRAMWSADSFDAHGLHDGPTFRRDAKVCDYMSWPVATLSDETDLAAAVDLMIEKKVSAVVIVRDNNFTGIITSEDMLKVLSELLKNKLPAANEVTILAYNSPLSSVAQMLSTAGV